MFLKAILAFVSPTIYGIRRFLCENDQNFAKEIHTHIHTHFFPSDPHRVSSLYFPSPLFFLANGKWQFRCSRTPRHLPPPSPPRYPCIYQHLQLPMHHGHNPPPAHCSHSPHTGGGGGNGPSSFFEAKFLDVGNRATGSSPGKPWV